MIDIPATIAATGALVTAIGVILAGYWSYRAKIAANHAKDIAERAEAKIVRVGDAVYEVGKALDGRLSALLKSESALARAEGHAEGEQAQRDRSADPVLEIGGKL